MTSEARAVLDMDLYARMRTCNRQGIVAAAICLRDLAAKLCDMRVAATHNIASSRPMIDESGNILASSVFGFDEVEEGWWLEPNLALTSPLVAMCRLESDPFWCNADGVWTLDGPHPYGRLAPGDFQQRALTNSALVVPVHLPFGQVGAVSFLPQDPEKTNLSQIFVAFSELLGIYARQFIASYARLERSPRMSRLSPTLTRREVECLHWASLGKTNDEIATVLDLTRSTIRFHIRNAAEKLDAVNRDQTVYKAAQLGYLASGQ